MDLLIAPDDPLAEDVRSLLEAHMSTMNALSPPEHVHALDVQQLLDPAVSFFGARRDGLLLGVGALKHLDEGHAEIKSMHTASAARRQGIGRAVLEHLLAVARERGYERVSLETGSFDAFAPGRQLYESMGFEACAPFGSYTVNPYSMCMTLRL